MIKLVMLVVTDEDTHDAITWEASSLEDVLEMTNALMNMRLFPVVTTAAVTDVA